MNNKISIDIEIFQEELSNLQVEQEKLLNIKKRIKDNYQKFMDLSMEGNVIEEIKNNYDYGLEITEKIFNELKSEIEKMIFAKEKYISAISNIDEKVGETNE